MLQLDPSSIVPSPLASRMRPPSSHHTPSIPFSIHTLNNLPFPRSLPSPYPFHVVQTERILLKLDATLEASNARSARWA